MITVISETLFVILFSQCVCRLSRSHDDVSISVRVGFVALALSAVLGLFAPYVLSIATTWPQVVLVGAIVLRQWATSHAWRQDVPMCVIKGKS